MNDFYQQIAGRRVFMTGCSGFIGRHLLRTLTDAGAVVTAWSRNRRGLASLKGAESARAIVGDLNDLDALESAVRDQDIVFHLAYDGRATAADNLSAFNSLYGAAERAKVGRFVQTSSIVVYDDWPNKNLDEHSSMDRPGGGPYRRAKIEMERILMVGTLPAAILQPTIVYGPGSALWTDQFAEQLAAGEVVLPNPEGHCNGVYVDDVVQALLRAAVVPDLVRERFIISGASTFPWSALLGGYAQIIGSGTVVYEPLDELKERLGPQSESADDSDTLSPVLRAYALGHKIIGRERFEVFVRFVKRQLARDSKAYPDHHLLELFSTAGICNISHARNRLGYQPNYDLEKGLAALEPYLGRY